MIFNRSLGTITGAYKDRVIANAIVKVPKCVSGHAVTSGKSGFYLLTLERAYHNLTTVLSIVKSNVAKPNRAWTKPSLPMNLTYPRLIVRLILDLG